MERGQEERAQISHKLGVVFAILISIILLLNFASFRILNSTEKSLKRVTHSFQHLILLERLESLISREVKELADLIVLGVEEIDEIEKFHQEILLAFKEIESFNHSQHDQKKEIKEVQKSYLDLHDQIIAAIEKWKKTGQMAHLLTLQTSLEENFEKTFLNFLGETITQEKKQVDEVNRLTQEKYTFETNLAFALIAISVIFAIFAYRHLQESLVSRKTLESTNLALQAKAVEKADAEQKVYRERQNLYNMLNFLPMAFHLQAPDYSVPFANKVFREQFGDPKKRKCYDLMHDRSQPCEVCDTFKVFDHQKDEVSIWESKDGRTYITVCTPFTDVDGSPLVMEMALDITEQENAKKEAIKAKDEAEQASRAKSEFLTRMSHELRTPMNAILGFSQLLDMDQENPLQPIQQNNVRHILKAGEHLLELINEILDLSKIESGKVSLSIEEVHTCPLITEVLDLLKPLLDEKKLNTNILPPDTSGLSVMADRVRLKQVLLNLVHNAIKYNRQGGSISISCTKLNDRTVQIRIEDTGIGIHPDNLECIFKPFQRVDSDREPVEGTGVGLTICRKLAHLMHGSLDVQSEEGKGSCFSIVLPEGKSLSAHKESDTTVWPEPPHQENRENNFKVLYIEDNPANMELVASILFRHNLELLQAPDAKLGIELAKAHKPDLILMDINLPGMDGYEALKVIKTFPALDSIPVIALSADSMESDVKKGLSAGFDDYICKPIKITPFLEKVNQYLV